MNLRFVIPSRLTSVVALAAVTLSAAEADEIDRIEREFLERRHAIIKPLAEAYATKLKSLHDSLKLRADVTRAAIVEAERRRVLASIGKAPAAAVPTAAPTAKTPANAPPAPEEQAVLQPANAKIRNENGSLTGDLNSNLAKAGTIAEWKLPNLRPGRYRLTIFYTCPKDAGGRCRLVIPPLAAITLSIEPNGEQRRIDLGEFDFATPPETVSLKVIELASDSAGLMTFESLRIDRIKPKDQPVDDPVPAVLAPLNL